MKYIKRILIIFVIASVGYLIANEYAGPFTNYSNEPTQTKIQTTNHSDGIVMYYFHGNRRCPTCKAIEKYSHEAVTPYLNDGKLIWGIVNVETQNNKHFIRDFELASSGTVIVEYKDNKITRWQALDKVWQLARDKEVFAKYVNDEVKRFIQ